ncbi:MAG: response regulator, partial [Stenotrophomonas nitritireducens]|nr:response regulator [Stenotrophomonas nitritireducens]
DFSLAELVQSIGLILGPQARVKRLDYRVFVESGVPDGLHGDVGHLRQILLNLAGNAVKFTDQGQVEIRVSVSPSGEDGPLRLRFEILDTGIGVPPSLRPRLFDAFEQADVSMARRHEGTGLGTAIAKGLAQAMGGDIGYRENLPAGSCFWVELPLGRAALAAADGEAAAAAEPLAVEDPGNVIAFTDPFRRHRARVRSLDILVADDHEANRMVLQRLLQKAGHRVTCVHGAEQALDAMAARDFDVAITDLHMPGMSGLDLLRQLRVMQAGGGARTPVVILSADVTPEAIQRCNQAGAHAFMAKPVVAARLLETMADIASGAAAGTRDMAAVIPTFADGDAVLDTGVLDELTALGMGKGFE